MGLVKIDMIDPAHAARATASPKSETAAGQTTIAVDRFAGRVLSHYRLAERLGAGGMGVLYRATDCRLFRKLSEAR